jgi:hypothetical protein
VNDPRLEAWLAVTRTVPTAPAQQCVAELAAAIDARETLRSSLSSQPEASCDDALRAALHAAEEALLRRAAELSEELRAQLAELRSIQSGVRGYRPPAEPSAKLISRNV